MYNNAELKNRYEVISVNNLGVLYVMTNDASVASLDDLRGRTVYSYGEGGTPEYTIEGAVGEKQASRARSTWNSSPARLRCST